MDRQSMYHLYKELLCKFGAIPEKGECYEQLITCLLDIYEKKNSSYPGEYF